MRKSYAILLSMLCTAGAMAERTIPVYDYVTFYDGYNVIPEDAPDEGCIMLKSYLKTKILTEEQLDAIGEHLTLQVNINARCDNYDRIGGVNLAFLPKGTETYTVTDNPAVDPLRIEIARFITPFMNKNKEPSWVTYQYQIDNISRLLRNPDYRDNYDIWMEFELFGVPYAANTEIAGCAGCVDVFGGTINLITDDEDAPMAATDVFVPVTTRDGRPDKGMNNYNEEGTDRIGKCQKKFTFSTPRDVKSGRVVIIMSNHGANSGGEEYNRRMHYIKMDDLPSYSWIPGRQSCEPFRVYNTQANGIYGYSSMSDAQWMSFSNWCPGAPIPYQTFETGEVKAGEHSITLKVPDAKFANKQGYFPVSIYFQGDTEGEAITAPIDFDTLQSGVTAPEAEDYESTVEIADGELLITAPEAIDDISLYAFSGEYLESKRVNGSNTCRLDMSKHDHGLYILSVAMGQRIEARKICY